MADGKSLQDEIDEIIVDCYSEVEVREAWGLAFEDNVAVPFLATLLGAPVEVRTFRVSGSGVVQARVVRVGEKPERERWISVEDLDAAGLPEDMAHILTLYHAWHGGDD